MRHHGRLHERLGSDQAHAGVREHEVVRAEGVDLVGDDFQAHQISAAGLCGQCQSGENLYYKGTCPVAHLVIRGVFPLDRARYMHRYLLCIGWLCFRLGVGFSVWSLLIVGGCGMFVGDLCMYARFARMFPLVSAREVIENLRRIR